MEIAILGAGVAGVSSAVALKQSGFDVSVYERHQAPSNIGAGIVIWPNAAYILEQLGVLDDIIAVSGTPTCMRRESNTGENLGVIDIQIINRLMGYPSLSILRQDLQNILISKLESLGVEIKYSHAVMDVKKTASNQAEVHFQNGLKIKADVFIGADGRMASMARRYVHGDNSPVYQGFINWIGVYESQEETFAEMAITDYWGVGARFGIVPISKRKAYWAGGIVCPEVGLKKPAEYKAELSAIFSQWPQAVENIIRYTSLERINKIFVHDHDPIKTWHKHNLIVIGDAAHAALPTSGQGACQALEDAWHLTRCLLEYPHNLQKTFDRFTHMRFEKTSSIIEAARGFASSLFNDDQAFCSARNQNSKQTDYEAMAMAMSRGWGRYLPLNTNQPVQ